MRYFKNELAADISTGSNVAEEQAFLRKFLYYVCENSDQFGAVIDGLNIAYFCKHKRQMALPTVSFL